MSIRKEAVTNLACTVGRSLGVAEEAKNQCEFAPCEGAAHRTIEFDIRTGGKGRYRWQCFVPCAAGWLNGNGGPMQTLGYMDGFIDVV